MVYVVDSSHITSAKCTKVGYSLCRIIYIRVTNTVLSIPFTDAFTCKQHHYSVPDGDGAHTLFNSLFVVVSSIKMIISNGAQLFKMHYSKVMYYFILCTHSAIISTLRMVLYQKCHCVSISESSNLCNINIHLFKTILNI